MSRPVSVTLAPAYGRDYKSQKAVMADWDANKDFEVLGGGGMKTSKEDFKTMALDLRPQFAQIRYDRLTKVISLDFSKEK